MPPDASRAETAIGCDARLPYVWPLAGPLGAVLLALMWWMSLG